MRTTKDRIRHALSFEIIGLILFTLFASVVFGYPLEKMGVIALAGSIVATIWNYFYNILFDRALLKIRGEVHKTVMLRVLHAVLFEGGLLVLFIPIIAWYLSISMWEAFMMDIVMTTFYLVYTFLFNIAYDRVFPIPADTKSNKPIE